MTASKITLTNVRHASTAVVFFYEAVAQSIGLSVSDIKYAEIIMRNGPVTAGQLGIITGLTSGAVTGLIDRLEVSGLVQRRVPREDRRRVLISAIPEQMDHVAQQMQQFIGAHEELLNTFSQEQVALINTYIIKLAALTETATQNLSQNSH